MGAWLSRVRQALSGRTTARGAVRRALISAQRSRARVELQPVWHRGELAKVIEATIEQVRANDLVISQPTIDGFRHPLAMREQLRMSFLTDDGLMTGRTEAKGRIKVPSGGEQMILGYRLTIPRSLEIDSRREHERVLVIPGLILEAELHTFSQHQPIHGVVLDISEGGMKIRCRNAKGKLGNGQRVYLKVELPDPIGLLTEMVRIIHVSPDERMDRHLIGIAFRHRIGGLGQFLEQHEKKQRRRLRRAG